MRLHVSFKERQPSIFIVPVYPVYVYQFYTNWRISLKLSMCILPLEITSQFLFLISYHHGGFVLPPHGALQFGLFIQIL